MSQTTRSRVPEAGNTGLSSKMGVQHLFYAFPLLPHHPSLILQVLRTMALPSERIASTSPQHQAHWSQASFDQVTLLTDLQPVPKQKL